MNFSQETRNQEAIKNRLPVLIIRSDANARIGVGHVMRCLALAQAWQDAGGVVSFVMNRESPGLEARLSSEGMEVVYLSALPGSDDDAMQTINIGIQRKAKWIVIDGYQFRVGYQRVIKDGGFFVLFIDDYGHADYQHADMILNQNIYASEKAYPKRESYTRLLLGTRYALLRREFWCWKKWKREIPEVARKVLVTLGGSDPENVTTKAVQALREGDVNHMEVAIVIGPANPHFEVIKNGLSHASFGCHLLSSVADMSELMAWADVAVSAGGSTCWELAYMGLPTLILVLAENQGPIAEGLEKAGIGMNLGWHEDVETDRIVQALKWIRSKKETRAGMSQRGRSMIDGMGAMRVCDCLLKKEK